MKNILYMSSPINAILEGFYRDDITIATLKEKGNFGIGTFNNLEGELIAINGNYFQLDLNGIAQPVSDDMKTPFSTVCFFKPMLFENIDNYNTYQEFEKKLKLFLPSDNMFYAIKMEGKFSYVKTRSVPKTENYKPLSEATDNQKISEFNNVEGFLVGFYTPSFVPSVNVPGYHFHFITKDFSRGGHLLNCEPEQIKIELQIFHSMELTLPKTLDYLTADFKRDAVKDLEKAEKE
jgi:acetolactate decarboxylase